MNCANHPDIAPVAYCRPAPKPRGAQCTRDVKGVIYCENCLAERLHGVQPPAVPPAGFVPTAAPIVPSSGPNPAVAGILAGFFPFGVGAVYCGQYAKGLAHLVVFTLLVWGESVTDNGGVNTILGLGIAFFYVYQIIDSIRTAKAIQMGQPAPDPMGLGHAFNMGDKFEPGKVPVGAVVLIGLGVLFLLHTMGIMEAGFERYWPLIIVFLGGWMFYRHWERAQQRGQCGRCRTRWLMGPAMVLTTGVLFLLQSTDVADR